MKEDVLEKLVRKAMACAGSDPCIFCWQGGEPLLAGMKFFKNVIEFQKKYGKIGQIVSNSIQTNATLLNNEWIRIFREYHFFIGASLDGPQEVHNCYRQYSSGKGSFKMTMEGINLLKKGGSEFNILSTIGKETAENPEAIYNFFISQDLYYLQFIPAVDRKDEQIADFSITSDQYGNFLCKLFDVWWNNGNPFVSIRLFDDILEILSQEESSCCMFKVQCGEYVVVEFNGDVYPCDFFVNPEWKLGNILEMSLEELFDKAHSVFGKLKETISQDCQNCRWNYICHNGCLWFRWVNSGSVKGRDYLCRSYKRFFEYTIDRFQELCHKVSLRSLPG